MNFNPVSEITRMNRHNANLRDHMKCNTQVYKKHSYKKQVISVLLFFCNKLNNNEKKKKNYYESKRHVSESNMHRLTSHR